jgi:hypothetical protein
VTVGDGYDGVVEGSVDMRDAFANHLPYLFLCLCRFSHASLLYGFSRTFTGPCVGAGALSAERQTAPVAHTAVYAHVHETFDIHRDPAAQVPFHNKPRDFAAELFRIFLAQLLHFGRAGDARSVADLLRAWPTKTVNRGQRDFDVFVYG